MTSPVTFPEEITLEKGPEIARALKDMLASEGWAYYISVVKQQQHTRFDRIVLEPLSCADKVYEQEFMKGELQGLRMAVTLPQALIDAIELEVSMLEAKLSGDRNEDE